MRRLVSSSVLALVAAVSLGAQDTTIKSRTDIKSDDAKAMTITGCVSGGPTTFALTNVAAQAPGKKSDDNKAVGTSGVVTSYVLTAREGVTLAPHVGHKVEVVGVVIPAAKDGDNDADVRVRERTEVQRDNAPDSKTETETKSRVARGPSAQFMANSIKMVSPICLE